MKQWNAAGQYCRWTAQITGTNTMAIKEEGRKFWNILCYSYCYSYRSCEMNISMAAHNGRIDGASPIFTLPECLHLKERERERERERRRQTEATSKLIQLKLIQFKKKTLLFILHRLKLIELELIGLKLIELKLIGLKSIELKSIELFQTFFSKLFLVNLIFTLFIWHQLKLITLKLIELKFIWFFQTF